MLPYVVSKFNNKYVICRRFERVTVLATDTTTANCFTRSDVIGMQFK